MRVYSSLGEQIGFPLSGGGLGGYFYMTWVTVVAKLEVADGVVVTVFVVALVELPHSVHTLD